MVVNCVFGWDVVFVFFFFMVFVCVIDSMVVEDRKIICIVK